MGQVIEDFNWVCHAYCLMSNHYHLLIETPDGNLSKGMRQLNGVFTQASNRRHDPYFFVVFACIKCLDKD
ncbi:transposase [Nitrosomonas aestuarii]|uniref:transposase n=1 Tax=Nitrosomonas aestuarii TaxID=52441 RepID=UPI003CC81B45